jgi:hypothetical protein
MKRFIKKLVKRIKKEVDEYMTSYKEVEMAKVELVKDGARALKSTIMDKEVSRRLGTIIICVGIGFLGFGGSLIAVSYID